MTAGVACVLAVGSGNKLRSFSLLATSPATAAAADAASLSSAQLGRTSAIRIAIPAMTIDVIQDGSANRPRRLISSITGFLLPALELRRCRDQGRGGTKRSPELGRRSCYAVQLA